MPSTLMPSALMPSALMPVFSRARILVVALLCAAVSAASPEKAPPTYIIHVVADDLGYNDVAWHNNQTHTPALNALVREGVELMDFYVYKMCAPSRASILSGRYPMHLGTSGVIWSVVLCIAKKREKGAYQYPGYCMQ